MKRTTRTGAYAVITTEGHVLLTLLGRGPNRGSWNRFPLEAMGTAANGPPGFPNPRFSGLS